MKKKFSLLINLAVICLCVCSIAIGVYAAMSASLTVSGQIGFTAHGVDFDATVKARGYAESKDATEYVEEDQSFTVTNNKANLGDMYFTDLAGNTIPSIVLTITVTNNSAFKVAATLVVQEMENVTYIRQYALGSATTKTAHSSAVVLDAKDGTNSSVTFTVILDIIYPNSSISNLQDLDVSVNLIKYVVLTAGTTDTTTTPGLIYTLNADQKSWSVKGDYTVSNDYSSIIEDNVPENVIIEPYIQGLPVTIIAEKAFGDHITDAGTKLKTIVIPTSITEILGCAFDYTNLTELSLPHSVVTFNLGSFDGNWQITHLTIPMNVKGIVFYESLANSSIRSIKFESSIPPYEANMLVSYGTTFYVPKGSYEAYYELINPICVDDINIIEY